MNLFCFTCEASTKSLRIFRWIHFGLMVLLLGVPGFVFGQEEMTARVDFALQVRPILSKHCFACHGPDEEHRESGLALHSADLAYARADSGEAGIVPGKPDESEIVVRIEMDDEDDRMPPVEHGPGLSAEEVALIRRWIEQGAEYGQHWAYRPIVRPELPSVTQTEWPRNGIDYFVLERMEKRGLSPAPRASPERLVRRLYQDLIGLPPPPEVVQEFARDPSEAAYERIVDSLLANPAYGEHWARMWLDLARYADSQGYAEDHHREIWLYRDWVIRAFNDDMPFDQFTREQLAGDLFENPTEDQLIATAFHRNTMTNTEGGTDDEEFRHAAVVDRTNTTATVWLGTTMACAQCHTHKYDPISLSDYYGMFAIFDQAEDSDRGDEHPVLRRFTAEQREERGEIELALSSAKERLNTLTEEADQQPVKLEIEELEKRLKNIRPETVPIMRELPSESRRATHVAIGGAFSNKGEVVSQRLWSEFAGEHAGATNRLGLASWLMSDEVPLTARVAANRHWEKIFGRGIVETSEDFGSQGTPPTHPELLDWLAVAFREQGWSMKQFAKLLVMSETYRQDSTATPEKLTADPDNRWLSRGARYRLTAEQIRDLALATSGLLSTKMYGPPARPPQPKSGLNAAFGGSLDWETSPGEDRYRRGVYTLIRRTNLYPSFLAFDATNRTICTVRRMNSNTPVAAFVTLNDPAFVECARALGRLGSEAEGSLAEQMRFVFWRVVSREPSGEELAELEALWNNQVEHYRTQTEQAAKLAFGEEAGDQAVSERASELAAWTVVGNVLLNLDEVLTRN